MTFDYDVLTVGLGPAGMAVSGMAQGMGLRVGSIEKAGIGGECMNVGCIPSKAILRVAKTRHMVNKYEAMSLEACDAPDVNNPFEKIQERLTFINEKKNKKMLSKVDMIFGEGPASFVDKHTMAVGDRKVRARKIFVCAGTLPARPPIEGLETIDVLTNRNIFSQERCPDSMLVLGGGAIACEMAQAFSRLGTKVTIVIRGEHLMRHADPDAVEILEAVFKKEGIEILAGAKMKRFSRNGNNVSLELEGGKTVHAEKVLVATGRTPNFTDMKLENAGVELNEKGYIRVNKHLQTSTPNIFAPGDCNGHHLFSHAAMHQGMIALMNSIAPRLFRMDFRKYVVPYTMFTEPQISWVGKTSQELDAEGVNFVEARSSYEDYGAAIAECCDTGYVKVLTSPSGRILGAGVVGEGSADMINEWALAIQKKMNIKDVMFLQHSFPSMSFLNKRASEIWMMQKMQTAGLMKSIAGAMIRL